jgi:hypothetical protein
LRLALDDMLLLCMLIGAPWCELGFSLFSLVRFFGELEDCTSLGIRLWYANELHFYAY